MASDEVKIWAASDQEVMNLYHIMTTMYFAFGSYSKDGYHRGILIFKTEEEINIATSMYVRIWHLERALAKKSTSAEILKLNLIENFLNETKLDLKSDKAVQRCLLVICGGRDWEIKRARFVDTGFSLGETANQFIICMNEFWKTAVASTNKIGQHLAQEVLPNLSKLGISLHLPRRPVHLRIYDMGGITYKEYLENLREDIEDRRRILKINNKQEAVDCYQITIPELASSRHARRAESLC